MQDRPQLAGVEMTPPPLRLVIVKRAKSPALRARPLRPGIVGQMDIHLTLLQIQVDPVYLPRLPDPAAAQSAA